MDHRAAKWLRKLERYLGWLAVPNIAILFVTLQAIGFFLLSVDPIWMDRIALLPDQVFAGEIWRVITFLALPLSTQLIWVIFTLWFIYFILNAIETEWGAFKTTFYVLVSVVLMVVMSLTLGLPVLSVADFESTLFLAAAALFPEYEILLFMVVPVKMKWLGWVTLAGVAYRLLTLSWLGKLFLLGIYANYILFFGPAVFDRINQWIRRTRYRKKLER